MTARPRRRWERLVGLPWSLRRQVVVLTASATAVAMLLLTLVLQVVLAHITDTDVDRVLEDRAEATVATIQASSTGTISVPEGTLDPGVVVFDDSGARVAGTVPSRLGDRAADLSRTRTTVLADADGSDQLRAQPFTVRGSGARGVVVVTERLEPYEEAESLALLVSLVTGAIATAATAAIAAWTVRRALRPVAEMAATASDWSEHDLGRRFALGESHDEISALASTLDTLLDRVSSAIRSEQRLTSELAHELRTPLTIVQGTADLVLLRDGEGLAPAARRDLQEVAAAGRRMATIITTLLDLARSEASVVAASSSTASEVVADVVGHVRAAGHHRQVRVEVVVDDSRLALPHALAVRTLSPVVDNALHFAETLVTIRSSVADGSLSLVVVDDGPGVDDAMADDIFEPGRTSGTSAGSGLGLAIARRIARTAGGEVEVATAGPTRGGRFVVRLPLA